MSGLLALTTKYKARNTCKGPALEHLSMATIPKKVYNIAISWEINKSYPSLKFPTKYGSNHNAWRPKVALWKLNANWLAFYFVLG